MNHSAPDQTPVVRELPSDLDVMTALQALAHCNRVLLLESSAIRAPRGRYSFLMADPLVFEDSRPTSSGTASLDILRGWSQSIASPAIAELPPFQGGIAGLLGYELGSAWEHVPAATDDLFQIPQLSVGCYPWVVAWDHLDRRTWLIAHGWTINADGCLGGNSAQMAEHRADQVAEWLSQRPQLQATDDPAPRNLPEVCGTVPLSSRFQQIFPGIWSDFTRESYLAAAQRVIDYIYAGDIFQANLTQRLVCRASLSLLELYRRLRCTNPAPFAGYYQAQDWTILSSSPERFLEVRDRTVSTRPIKGTRRRNSQPEADLFLRDSLRQSEKDQAENVMIVDLMRNDLSRVCQPGSVRVPQLCDVETYATVQHLVSEVQGLLLPECDVWSLLAATLPGGSITGAPKVRAMQIISELEPSVRGPYTGSLFYVGHDGRMDSNLLIRTFTSRHGWLQCGVGGGIVAQSDPVTEYEESWHKAAALLRALGLSAEV